jgi:hypothetical protein
MASAASEQRACTEKVRLVANYGATVAAYYSSVSKLEQSLITGVPQTYNDRRRDTEEARCLCDAARQALDDHVSAHEC